MLFRSVVMVPMGRSTTARENSVYANMHGINIQGSIDIMFSDSLMANIKMETDSKYDSLLKDDDIKNVFRTEMMPMPGFEEAYYVIFTYKEKDYVTKKYVNKAEARCYMKLDDNSRPDFCSGRQWGGCGTGCGKAAADRTGCGGNPGAGQHQRVDGI